MSQPASSPEKLVSVPNDFEAAMIVSALAARDIDATTTGSYTAGFRAEAPGEVKVLVRQDDLQRARAALSEIRGQIADDTGQASSVGTGSANGVVSSGSITAWWIFEALVVLVVLCFLAVRLF